MPIRVFIQEQGGFTHEDAGILILAFEYTLRKLRGVKRTDTVAIVIARQIIAIARSGERDPQKISASAIAALRRKRSTKGRNKRLNPDSI